MGTGADEQGPVSVAVKYVCTSVLILAASVLAEAALWSQGLAVALAAATIGGMIPIWVIRSRNVRTRKNSGGEHSGVMTSTGGH